MCESVCVVSMCLWDVFVLCCMMLYGFSCRVLFCVCACVFCHKCVDAWVCVLFAMNRVMLYDVFVCCVFVRVYVIVVFV